MRRSSRALAVVGLLGTVFVATFADAVWLRAGRAPARPQAAEMVRRLGLTDLCRVTEARYTRHLSQADLNTAFQDHPLSLEHFPSGSFTQPTIHSDSP